MPYIITKFSLVIHNYDRYRVLRIKVSRFPVKTGFFKKVCCSKINLLFYDFIYKRFPENISR